MIQGILQMLRPHSTRLGRSWADLLNGLGVIISHPVFMSGGLSISSHMFCHSHVAFIVI